MSTQKPLRVAIAGFGAIGFKVAEALDAGIPGLQLSAVSAQDRGRAETRMAGFRNRVPVVEIDRLEPTSDLVIECAPSQLLGRIVEPFLKAGKTAIVLSCGALLADRNLLELAKTRGQIIVPTGALLGLDAVTAAAEGTIHSVRMITRKPLKALVGAPYLSERQIDLSTIKEPMLIFKGSAVEAATGFPANLNVAAALSLAGIGPDRTQVEIWADPSVTRNIHRIELKSDSSDLSMSIENIPSENPKTGRITALSVIACLRKMRAPLRVGT